jgi:hypothetical protein
MAAKFLIGSTDSWGEGGGHCGVVDTFFFSKWKELMQIKYILIQMPSCEQMFRQMAVQNFNQIAIIITKNTVIKKLNLSKFMSTILNCL